MPSLLRRLTRISFRSEMLIINLLGLVNSTLDWVPLKWSSEVESVGSLPLTKESFAFNTISADRIRSILTWIVLAKVLVDNLHIVSYFSNIYTVITWSRPLLLIPWILFSFFKNFILEVLIFAIGILLALEERLPLFLVIEFVIVKVVQFNLASYTWYLNTRLYFFLKCRDKLLNLRKGARSGSTATNGLNYLPRLRSKSLTTLLSYESSNSTDFSDSASRIFNAPDLTPMEKTMKVLGVTEQEVLEARNKKQQQEFRHEALTSSTDMNVPSTTESSGLTDLNTEQCSVPTSNTNRERSQGKKIEDKTASFYFLRAPADLPLGVSNVLQWSDPVSPITPESQPIGKTIAVVEAPKHETKEDSTTGAAKDPSHFGTTVLSSVTKMENLVQEPVNGSSVGHMDTLPSNPEVVEKVEPQQESSVIFTSTETTERPCTSVMRRKEQNFCSAKSGIGECPIGKCMNLSDHSETGNTSSNQIRKPETKPENKQMHLCKNLNQAHKTTKDTPRNKEHSNPEEEVGSNNGQRSGEPTVVNSSIFFDANDKSFANDEEECDGELSPNSSRVKRKLCHVKDLKCETSRKMQKVEECSSTSSVEAERTFDIAEEDTNGIERCQMSEGQESEHAVASAQSTIPLPKSSGSGTEVVLTGGIVITENVAADFENALVTRKMNYAEFIRSAVTERYQTQLGKMKSPNTKPRKTYYSQQTNRPTFYTSPKIQAREVENWTTSVRICHRRLPRNNAEDILNNNVENQLDSQSSISSNVTVRPDRQRKDSRVLKPKSENIGPLPENTRALNFKNVTIRNQLASRSLGSSHSIGSTIVPTKDKKSANEGKQKMTSTGVTGTHSSAARAVRFKAVKAHRASKEVILSANITDSMNSQQNDGNLLNSVSLTDAGNTGLLDHCNKENIYSLKSAHPVFYTGALHIASHKSQDVILMNAEGFDDLTNKETRRRLTKFSTSKEEEGESSISAICSKRIEGQQEGKDLVRTFAKEDVRNVVTPTPLASTSTDPQIKQPSQYQMVITDKFHSDENSSISENSSCAVNSAVMESDKERQGTSVSVVESIEKNSFDRELNSTVTSPASYDEACFSSSIHDIQDTVNVVMKTVDRLEKKMDLSEIIDHATTTENIEMKNDNNDESGQNLQSINECNVNESTNEIHKPVEICDKEESEESQSVDLQRLEESDKVIDLSEDSCKNEELHTGFDVVQPESSGDNDTKEPESQEIMKKSESDDNSHQLGDQLEKVLGTIEYNNTNLPDANLNEKEMQPNVLKIGHLESCEKSLAEPTEEVKSEEKCGTSPIISISSGAIPKRFLKLKSPTIEIPEENTPEEEATSIPPNEELEEPLEVVDTTDVPEPRLPLTTIALFFILVINFYLNYFYRHIIKPVATYILSSIFLTIFSLVGRFRSSPLVPPVEVSEVEECVELLNSENEDLPKMKSDIFSSENKSEVEEGADTETALSSLVKDEEPKNSDSQLAHSTNTEQTTSVEEGVGHPRICETNQSGVVNALHNPLFQKYRNGREDESDVEDSFRCLKKSAKSVRGEGSVPLGNESVQMTGSEHEGHEVAMQMAKLINDLHLYDSEASIDTMQSDSGKDTASLGQASSFEEFRQDSISQAESQI